MLRLRAVAKRWLTPSGEAVEARPLTRGDLLLAGLLVVAVTWVYLTYALRVGSFQADEQHYMVIARYIPQHFPSALWTIPGYGWMDGFGQRLDVYFQAIAYALFRGPRVFKVGHAIQCLLFASTALPVYLLGRRAGLGRAGTLLAASLCVVVPWAVTATSFLAEPASYPAFAWVLYATWLTVRRPSWSHDLFAISALFVAGLARTELLGLAPLLPLAILWHEWTWGLADVPRKQRSPALLRRVWAGHRLLSAIVVVGLLAVLADQLGLPVGSALSSLTGHYGLPSLGPLSSLLLDYRYDLSRMVVGTGFLALALALPWTLGMLVRPRDGGRHALAVVCTLGFAAILVALIQIGPTGDERYTMYLAVPVVVAAGAALNDWSMTRRLSSAAALGVVASALALAVLLGSVAWPPLASPYGWFTYPAATFYQRVLLLHAAAAHLPVLAPGTVVEILVVIAAIVFVAIARWAVRPAAVLMAISLLALGLTDTLYNLHKYVVSAAGGGPNQGTLSWVDATVPADAKVGALALSLGATPAYLAIWNAVEFWNTSVVYGVFFEPAGAGSLPFQLGSNAISLRVRRPSGLLRIYPTPTPALRYLLVPVQAGNSIGLQGQVIASSPWVPLELVKLSLPARIDWTIAGTDAYGHLTSGRPSRVVIYSGALAGQGQRCATFSLITPPGFSGRWPYTVSVAGDTIAGSLRASEQAALSVPLPLRAAGENLADALSVSVRGEVPGGTSTELASFAVGSCKSRRITVALSRWPPT